MSVYVYVYVHTYICVYTYTCTRKHAHTHTYTHIHTHTHSYMLTGQQNKPMVKLARGVGEDQQPAPTKAVARDV